MLLVWVTRCPCSSQSTSTIPHPSIQVEEGTRGCLLRTMLTCQLAAALDHGHDDNAQLHTIQQLLPSLTWGCVPLQWALSHHPNTSLMTHTPALAYVSTTAPPVPWPLCCCPT